MAARSVYGAGECGAAAAGEGGVMMRTVSIRGLLARVVVGGVLVASGVVHLALTPEHFDEGAWQGWLFAVDGLALIASGLWFTRSRSNAAALAAAGTAILTAVAYVASRMFGLPVFGRESWDSVGLVVTAGEITAFALALLAVGHAGSFLKVSDSVRVSGEHHAG